MHATTSRGRCRRTKHDVFRLSAVALAVVGSGLLTGCFGSDDPDDAINAKPGFVEVVSKAVYDGAEALGKGVLSGAEGLGNAVANGAEAFVDTIKGAAEGRSTDAPDDSADAESNDL